MSIREEVASQLAQLSESEVIGVGAYIELTYAVQPDERVLGGMDGVSLSVEDDREASMSEGCGAFWVVYLLSMGAGALIGALLRGGA